MNPDSTHTSPHVPKTPSREFEATGSSRAHVYMDDETLHRMIETFGPLDFTQFAATLANPHESLAYSEAASLGWTPELPWGGQENMGRKKSRSPRVEANQSPDQRYLMNQPLDEGGATSAKAAEAQKESLMEWFDRSVEKELQKRRDIGSETASPVDPALAPLKAKHTLKITKSTAERMAETSASRVEIAARLESDFTTELTDAVEKLAKAETMANYTEALQAAEEAALNAPPELMEQAAAAEAKRIQTEFSKVKETIPGMRPIEVVGYVGITKPAHPKKPN